MWPTKDDWGYFALLALAVAAFVSDRFFLS